MSRRQVTFAAKISGERTVDADNSITLDGCDMGKVRSMHISAEVGDVRRVHLELLHPDIDVSFPAVVDVKIAVIPGYYLCEEPQADGTTRYRCVMTPEHQMQERTRREQVDLLDDVRRRSAASDRQVRMQDQMARQQGKGEGLDGVA